MPSQLNLCLFLFIALNLQSKMELNTTATKRGSPEAAPVASHKQQETKNKKTKTTETEKKEKNSSMNAMYAKKGKLYYVVIPEVWIDGADPLMSDLKDEATRHMQSFETEDDYTFLCGVTRQTAVARLMAYAEARQLHEDRQANHFVVVPCLGSTRMPYITKCESDALRVWKEWGDAQSEVYGDLTLEQAEDFTEAHEAYNRVNDKEAYDRATGRIMVWEPTMASQQCDTDSLTDETASGNTHSSTMQRSLQRTHLKLLKDVKMDKDADLFKSGHDFGRSKFEGQPSLSLGSRYRLLVQYLPDSTPDGLTCVVVRLQQSPSSWNTETPRAHWQLHWDLAATLIADFNPGKAPYGLWFDTCIATSIKDNENELQMSGFMSLSDVNSSLNVQCTFRLELTSDNDMKPLIWSSFSLSLMLVAMHVSNHRPYGALPGLKSAISVAAKSQCSCQCPRSVSVFQLDGDCCNLTTTHVRPSGLLSGRYCTNSRYREPSDRLGCPSNFDLPKSWPDLNKSASLSILTSFSSFK